MTAQVEFPRPIKLDSLGAAPRAVTITATADERATLARRFGLLSIERLSATANLHRQDEAVLVDGRLEAEVVQACVATGDPLPARVAEPFALRFVPIGSDIEAEDVELDEGELDVVSYEGAVVDLGEAVAQTLSLALDPFPRAADADSRMDQAELIEEAEANPFAALKSLKGKLGG